MTTGVLPVSTLLRFVLPRGGGLADLICYARDATAAEALARSAGYRTGRARREELYPKPDDPAKGGARG